MIVGTIFALLLGVGISGGPRCRIKYWKKWPHCVNIKCMSGTRAQFDAQCVADANCNGYSFTASQIKNANGHGSGCLKKQCSGDGTNGFGNNSHGYRECGTGCRTKYTKKWPHCVNIKCMTAKRWKFALDCLRDKRCNGYSFTASEINKGNGNGSGCLKQQCVNNGSNGFGQNSHGYRECGALEKVCSTKYRKKWPHCVNIKCMNTARSTFESECKANSQCNGYSFPSSQVNKANGSGFGCLKKQCKNNGSNGFGHNSHGYRVCYYKVKAASLLLEDEAAEDAAMTQEEEEEEFESEQENQYVIGASAAAAGVMLIGVGAIAVYRRRQHSVEYELISEV